MMDGPRFEMHAIHIWNTDKAIREGPLIVRDVRNNGAPSLYICRWDNINTPQNAGQGNKKRGLGDETSLTESAPPSEDITVDDVFSLRSQ